MKRAPDEELGKRLGEEREVSPLEERILRMHLGVPTPKLQALEDGSQGRADLGDSLSRIEADVLRRAQGPEPPRERLRLVKPGGR